MQLIKELNKLTEAKFDDLLSDMGYDSSSTLDEMENIFYKLHAKVKPL